MHLSGGDLHPHIQARMRQRGISLAEIEQTISEGWRASDARQGTEGKTLVFTYGHEWEGTVCAEKEVTVYYKTGGERPILLTVKARSVSGFRRKG